MKTEETRKIGLAGATLIGVGAIVGGGVLALAGAAFDKAGPATLLAFVLNGGIAVLTALSYAEMSTAFPENGGAYTFTKKLLNVRAAFGMGWIVFFASIAAGVLYALGFSAYALEAIAELLRVSGREVPVWLHTRPVSVATALAAIVFYGIILTRRSGGSGVWETVGKVIVFILIILGGIWFLVRHPESMGAGKLRPFFPSGGMGMLAAMGYTFIALQGFDIIAAVAGEVKEPERTLPRAMLYSLGIALIIYLPLLFVVMTAGVPPGQTVGELAAANPETVIADAVRTFMGPVGYWLVMVAAILAMLSALLANLLASSRIALAMAKDRTLPRRLTVLEPKRSLPVRAVWTSAAVMLLILLVVPNVAAAGAAAGLIFLLSYALTHVTCILARRRGGADFGAFRVPWFPLLPILGLISCVALALFQGFQEPSAGVIMGLWLILGFGMYGLMLSNRASVWDARSEATDPALIKLRGRSPLVLVPLANPAHALAMVEVAKALAPTEVGRVMLLSVMRGRGQWSRESEPPPELKASQDVIGAALAAAVRIGINPEALITMAGEPWGEIVRVANLHRCESLLLGMSDISGSVEKLAIEPTIQGVAADVVIMGSPPGWHLEAAQQILVPIGGGGGHDELRARLLSSLCRGTPRHVRYLRVVPAGTPPGHVERMQRDLLRAAEEEVPHHTEARILLDDDPVGAIEREAAACDLIVLGLQVRGGQRIFSKTVLSIARAAGGGVIMISKRI